METNARIAGISHRVGSASTAAIVFFIQSQS
jgi:hypothetical protein